MRTAENAEGRKASGWCGADEGSVSLEADMVYYKVTYAKCAVTDDDADSRIITEDPKGAVEITRRNTSPKSMEPKDGKIFYLHQQTIPAIDITDLFKKLSCDVLIIVLSSLLCLPKSKIVFFLGRGGRDCPSNGYQQQMLRVRLQPPFQQGFVLSPRLVLTSGFHSSKIKKLC